MPSSSVSVGLPQMQTQPSQGYHGRQFGPKPVELAAHDSCTEEANCGLQAGIETQIPLLPPGQLNIVADKSRATRGDGTVLFLASLDREPWLKCWLSPQVSPGCSR
jgi:hypothetical protein